MTQPQPPDEARQAGGPELAGSQTLSAADANCLGPGATVRIRRPGLARHDIDGESATGTYVSQFESPRHGRMIVLHVAGHGNYGFRLEELEPIPRPD